jgi:uncharacterized cupin superfamily protein
MSDEMPIRAVAAADLPVRRGSSYPKRFAGPCAERSKRQLGDHFGLDDFGVNLVELPPGVWSSQRHWHSAEDEFVYILSGEVTLVTDEGEQRLGAGMCVGFRAGLSNGHHLINKTERTALVLEVGSRKSDDDCYYSDIDMKIENRGSGAGFTDVSGASYED